MKRFYGRLKVFPRMELGRKVIPWEHMQVEIPHLWEFLSGERREVIGKVFEAIAIREQIAPVEEGVVVAYEDHDSARVVILRADDFLASPTKIVDQTNGRACMDQVLGKPLGQVDAEAKAGSQSLGRFSIGVPRDPHYLPR